jgi:hypothetical protein
MISENDYYVRAFSYARGAGYVYEGSGVYTKDGKRVRVRTFAAWEQDKSKGYVEPAEEVAHAA